MKKVSILQNVLSDEMKPAVSLLMETDFTKEIRIIFKKDQSMDEHQAPFPITVQIVEGDIDFGVKGEVYRMNRGDLITLSGGVPHDLKALTDSVVRLTLSKKDQAQRVASVGGA